eukprot:56462_1
MWGSPDEPAKSQGISSSLGKKPSRTERMKFGGKTPSVDSDRCSPGKLLEARETFLEHDLELFAIQRKFLERVLKTNQTFIDDMENHTREYVMRVSEVAKTESVGRQSCLQGSAAILASQTEVLISESRYSTQRITDLVEEMKSQFDSISSDLKALKTEKALAQDKLKEEENCVSKSAARCKSAADVYKVALSSLKSAEAAIGSTKYKMFKDRYTKEVVSKRKTATERCDQAFDLWRKHEKITHKFNKRVLEFHSSIVPNFTTKLDGISLQIKKSLFRTLARRCESQQSFAKTLGKRLAAFEGKSSVENAIPEFQDEKKQAIEFYEAVDPTLLLLDPCGATDPDEIIMQRPY